MPLLSIAENIFLGNERRRNGIIDWHAAFSRTGALLKKVGLKESPQHPHHRFGVGKQQLVEIATGAVKEVKLLILDEPTASRTRATATRCWRAEGIPRARHFRDPDLAQDSTRSEGRRFITIMRDRRDGRQSRCTRKRSTKTASSAAWWDASGPTAPPSAIPRSADRSSK